MTFVNRPIASSTKVEPSARHFGGGNAIGLAGFRENAKDPEVEGIVSREERERDAQYAGHDGEIRLHRSRYGLNHALGDRIDAPAGRAKVDTQWRLCCLVHSIETLANNGYAA